MRTLFYAVGIAAGTAYVVRRSRTTGAPDELSAAALARIEARLARLEASLDGSPGGPLPPVLVPTYEARTGRLAHERRLSALERRLTSVERTRSRQSLLFAKPNGTSGEDRRHG